MTDANDVQLSDGRFTTTSRSAAASPLETTVDGDRPAASTQTAKTTKTTTPVPSSDSQQSLATDPSSDNRPSALIVEDDASSLEVLAELVRQEKFVVTTAQSIKEARAYLAKQLPDVLLSDLVLPDGSGMELLRDIEDHEDKVEVVLITGHASTDTAIEALRRGVTDYLTKPIDVARLVAVLASVSRTRELREEIGNLRGQLRKLGRFGLLIGGSPAMQKLYDMIARVAPTDVSVLLIGESGTGKELTAQTIQQFSKRRKAPFLPLNCGAISANLIESELFGHEKGSFTGAARQHRGYFERAHGGTLFLDEITEMPIDLQVKLLRVLETGMVLRVGGDQPITVDVRVIAATNRDPDAAVAAGKLREDLLYRLSVFPVRLPALRERQGDIRLLAERFLAELNQQEGADKDFSSQALDRLESYPWPGNVRELKNTIQRVFILSDGEIGEEFLSPSRAVESVDTPASRLLMRVGMSIAEAEKRLILATLESHSHNMKRTAQVLGISLKTLYNRMNEYKRANGTHSMAGTAAPTSDDLLESELPRESETADS